MILCYLEGIDSYDHDRYQKKYSMFFFIWTVRIAILKKKPLRYKANITLLGIIFL